MEYSSVIFDWDGTLGMTLHLWLLTYKSELKKLGHNLLDEIIIEDFFYEREKIVNKYPGINFYTFMIEVQNYMTSHVTQMKLYVGTRESLERLKDNNITLTLVSSSPRKLLEKVLKLNDLTRFFSAISGSDDIMKHKPDPEPFLNIIEIAKLDPKTTLIIGDSSHDITAAKAIGLDSCLFLPNVNKLFYDFKKLKESNPTYCVENLKDFADIILNNS